MLHMRHEYQVLDIFLFSASAHLPVEYTVVPTF